MRKILLITSLIFLVQSYLTAQPDRWQQAIKYEMVIDFDTKNHQFTGTQKIDYTNNSPEELDKVFYHLYFNAFQPGSMMDMRNRALADSDQRVGGRISKLSPEEIGYQKVTKLTCNGKPVKYEIVGTILEVSLNEPIAPNSTAVFEMEFNAQVPVQIRRSGRFNKEGIDYSMTQWYPKMAEYDYQGWHANPYIGREFYGVWGDFDVKIKIDKDFILGGTGYLQNPEKIGYGYEAEGQKVKRPKGKKLTWHFIAPNVHDFAWAADPDYTHIKQQAKDGPMMHFLYKKNDKTEELWPLLPQAMDESFTYINKKYGKYPYEQYSFIQGGDGGMEYPMATLITGERNFGSLVGVSVHELMHSWYQMMMGTNEALYAWMDEGFTSYASDDVMNYLRTKVPAFAGKEVVDFPQAGSLRGYANFSSSGAEEPLSIHADHFTTNAAYGVGSYVKGNVFLAQLEYIMGTENFEKGILAYYDTWKFKHPNPNDFIRVMEKVSGLELDWYKEYMVNSTHTIDYGIKSVEEKDNGVVIELQRVGMMPMPVDVTISYQDGTEQVINIPMVIMRGKKPQPTDGTKLIYAPDWPWTNLSYDLVLPGNISNISAVTIDAKERMADVDRENNRKVVK